MQSLTYRHLLGSLRAVWHSVWAAVCAAVCAAVRAAMSDTVRRMRSSGLSLLVACAACHVDASLEISVEHPPGYAVTRTVIKAYFGDDVTCAQIQYGDRTDAELAAITVAEAAIPGGGRLEVSRLGGKAIVARGYDAQERYVTAGCQDLGEIVGDARVQITTEPTSVVAIDSDLPDRPFSEREIVVNMADTRGAARDGMVSWQLIGPAGAPEQQPSPGTATSDGEVDLQVADLGTTGPQSLRIRVPWAIAPLPQVTGFDLSSATTIPLPGGTSAGRPSCDLRGHAGQLPTLVCLGPPDLQQHRDVVEISWRDGRYVTQVLRVPDAIDDQFALFVDRDGSADEPVYIISANAVGVGNWYKLGAPGTGTPTTFGGGLQAVIYVPRCRNGASPLVGVQTTTGTLASRQQFFSPAGAPVEAAPQDGEILSGGCVADIAMREHQAVVVGGANGFAVLVLLSGTGRMQIPGLKATGSGFVAVETQGVIEKRFVGTRLQATGTVVFEAVLAPAVKSAFRLIERTEVEAAAPPGKIIGGKLDADGDTDLMWDLNTGLRRRVFQVSLAKRVNGAPLTAMTSGPVPFAAANTASYDFLAGDLDGQHTDEMVVFTSGEVTIYSPD
jgi:hypothetical protein